MEALTTKESSHLAQCEQAIERGLGSFLRVGRALLRIRDSRLYRSTDPTFEAYCQRRWEMGRSRAYGLIAQAKAEQIGSPLSNSKDKHDPDCQTDDPDSYIGSGGPGEGSPHDATGQPDPSKFGALVRRGLTDADRQELVETSEEALKRRANQQRAKARQKELLAGLRKALAKALRLARELEMGRLAGIIEQAIEVAA